VQPSIEKKASRERKGVRELSSSSRGGRPLTTSLRAKEGCFSLPTMFAVEGRRRVCSLPGIGGRRNGCIRGEEFAKKGCSLRTVMKHLEDLDARFSGKGEEAD